MEDLYYCKSRVSTKLMCYVFMITKNCKCKRIEFRNKPANIWAIDFDRGDKLFSEEIKYFLNCYGTTRYLYRREKSFLLYHTQININLNRLINLNLEFKIMQLL